VDDSRQPSHISQIATNWSLVERAHRDGASDLPQAQLALFVRYQNAIRRYLVVALGDPEAADDVFQEFALRLLRGDLHRATPEKGRFRDYLKTSLIRLVIDHRRRKARQIGRAHALDPGFEAAAVTDKSARTFEDVWQSSLVERAWEALRQLQAQGGAPYYTVLRHRCDHPEAPAAEIASALDAALKPSAPFSEEGIRKLLQRAREKFGEALLDDLAVSLGTIDFAAIEDELVALRLLPFCRAALERRRREASTG
jgi:RNA polymerase sigma-70 factor (ECF subfamily)